MQIRITKNTGKPHIIRYMRDDGSDTWMYADDFFIRHDLSHYALESILGYRTAFNGMLNNGMDIKDFEDREKRAALTVTDEAYYAENMANLFLIEIAQKEFPDFNAVQQSAFRSFNNKHPLITLPGEKITAIRAYLRDLLEQWNTLQPGKTLELIFEV